MTMGFENKKAILIIADFQKDQTVMIILTCYAN